MVVQPDLRLTWLETSKTGFLAMQLNCKNTRFIHVFLGVKSYLKPQLRHQNMVLNQHRPARLRFMDENDFACYDIACGFGFTLFAVKEKYRYSVYGTGINTDSQLGLHEFPRKSGKS